MQLQHFLWDFQFSDPYRAYSYDTLHSDDLGKWGKHLWELTLSILEESGAKGKLTQRYLVYLLLSQARFERNLPQQNGNLSSMEWLKALLWRHDHSLYRWAGILRHSQGLY